MPRIVLGVMYFSMKWACCAQEAEVSPSYSTSTKTVLCVDDDQAILSYEKMLLESAGYAVLSAVSGTQALRLVTMCRCDIVLLDYEMPDTSGYDLAREIRRVRPELAIVLMFGTDVPTGALALVDAFMLKLEASHALLPVIEELCARPRLPEEGRGLAG